MAVSLGGGVISLAVCAVSVATGGVASALVVLAPVGRARSRPVATAATTSGRALPTFKFHDRPRRWRIHTLQLHLHPNHKCQAISKFNPAAAGSGNFAANPRFAYFYIYAIIFTQKEKSLNSLFFLLLNLVITILRNLTSGFCKKKRYLSLYEQQILTQAIFWLFFLPKACETLGRSYGYIIEGSNQTIKISG